MHIHTNLYIHNGTKNLNEEENARISMIRDTYHQIASQFNSKSSTNTTKYFEDFERLVEKTAWIFYKNLLTTIFVNVIKYINKKSVYFIIFVLSK